MKKDEIQQKRDLIAHLINQSPNLSNRAIARLADVTAPTVASVRIRMDLPYPEEREEASGRKARGQKPATVNTIRWDVLPVVYRCYGRALPGRFKKPELLYVGCSIQLFTRLAVHHETSSWFREIKTIRLTHYSTQRLAEAAEAYAIRKERPKYNKRESSDAVVQIQPLKRRLSRIKRPQ